LYVRTTTGADIVEEYGTADGLHVAFVVIPLLSNWGRIKKKEIICSVNRSDES